MKGSESSDANQSEDSSVTEHEQLIQSRLRSLAPECDSLKMAYDTCFQEFFTKFLSGPTADPCEQKLREYQKCLRGTLVTMGLDMTEVDASKLDSEKIAAMLNQR